MTLDTIVVTNPKILLQRSDLTSFDIAFLDADMKPMDGIEVGRALKKQKSEIIIVFVSAYLEFAPKDTPSMRFVMFSNRISKTHCLYAFQTYCNNLHRSCGSIL